MSEPPPLKKNELPKQPMSGRESYNLVSDTIIGPNFRLMDNLIQAFSILVSMGLGSGVGLLLTPSRIQGILLGGFCGMVLGLFISGIVLGIYRASRHAKGKHD
jgi:hypothetical protein